MRRLLRIGYWGLGVLVCVGLPLYSMISPRWVARTVLVPSSDANAAMSPSILALAASGGAGLLGMGTSLDFVRSLFLDAQVLQQVVQRPVDSLSGEMTVAEAIGSSGLLDGEGTVKAARALRDNLRVNLDVSAQSLTVAVITIDSAAALPVLMQLVQTVDSIHRASRVRQAAELRSFMELQVKEARGKLGKSEDQLEAFLAVNRTLGTPRLQMQATRLERLVELDRQWAQSVEVQLAQALFNEAKNIPVLSTAVPPSTPLQPDPSRFKLSLMIGMAFLGVQGLLVFVILPRLANGTSVPAVDWLNDTLRPGAGR